MKDLTAKDIVNDIVSDASMKISFEPEKYETMIENYARQKKIAGSRQLATLVKQMRDAQNRYFQTRSDDALKQSKQLESQVDRVVKMITG
jgi:hypothetical protein